MNRLFLVSMRSRLVVSLGTSLNFVNCFTHCDIVGTLTVGKLQLLRREKIFNTTKCSADFVVLWLRWKSACLVSRRSRVRVSLGPGRNVIISIHYIFSFRWQTSQISAFNHPLLNEPINIRRRCIPEP